MSCNQKQERVEKSLEQQKLEYQAKELEIERQKIAIEREKIALQKQKDSLLNAASNTTPKQPSTKSQAVADPAKTKEADPVRLKSHSKDHSETTTIKSPSQEQTNHTTNSAPKAVATTHRERLSKADKGVIIGTVGGAAAGAIISKKNPGAGAVIGGILGGATGYTIGRAEDKKR